MHDLQKLDRHRFVGDRRTMLVHDRWHEDCEDCLMEEIISSGNAVYFEPDTLDQSLDEDFEPCEHCFDKRDPEPPSWANPQAEPDASPPGRQAQSQNIRV